MFLVLTAFFSAGLCLPCVPIAARRVGTRRAIAAGRLLIVSLPGTVSRDAVLSAARRFRDSPLYGAVNVAIDRTPLQQQQHSADLQGRDAARAAGHDAYFRRDSLSLSCAPPVQCLPLLLPRFPAGAAAGAPAASTSAATPPAASSASFDVPSTSLSPSAVPSA